MKNRWLSPILGVLVAIAISPAVAQETSRYQEPYPQATSKKGRQVEIVDDALALGIEHATFNVNLCQLVAPHVGEPANKDQPKWRYADKDYYFDSGYVAQLDRNIQALSRQGVLVNLIT